MSDIATKLSYLGETKGKIKDSINLTGANLTTEPFRNYAVVLKDKLAEMLNDPTPIWNNFPKTTATGSTISVNTYSSWFDYSLEGNTTQEGTPTPSSPQQINNVTGLQEVEVCGKNLFDEIFRQGSESSTSPTSYCFSNNDLVLSSGTYTLVNTLPSGFDYAIFGTTNPFPNSQTKTYNSGWRTGTTTFTINQDLHIGILVRKGGNNFTPTDISSYTFMIYKGTYDSALPYEPYKGKSYEVNLGKNLMMYSSYNANEQRSMKIPNLALKSDTYTMSFDLESFELGNTTSFSLYLGLFFEDGSSRDITIITLNNNISLGRKSLLLTTTKNLLANNQNNIRVGATDYDNGARVKITNIQLEKGSQATSYSPYFTPIELNKISTYKDYIFKGKGVNLFDEDNANILNNMYIDGTNSKIASSTGTKTLYIPIIGGTTYTVSKIVSQRFSVATTRVLPTGNVAVYNRQTDNTGTNLTINTTSEDKYLCVFYLHPNDTLSEQTILDSIMIQEGSVATKYEPYNAKDKWLLHKEIGKVVLNGSEYWNYDSTNNVFINNTTLFNGQYLVQNGVSNYYKNIVNDTITGNYQAGQVLQNNQFSFRVGTKDRLYLKDTRYTNTTDYKSWLSSNNLIVYYVLANPTTEEITNTELISQLNSLELLNGLNNITITGDLSAIMDLIALEKE